MPDDPAARLIDWFRAGVRAADPVLATEEATRRLPQLGPSVWVIAVGKGAHAMASGAVQALRERRAGLAGGLVIAHADEANATHGLASLVGDHPVPSHGSFTAATRLGEISARVPSSDDALVLVSGGATSLMAGPADGMTERDVPELFEALLASGADIEMMNALRKRALRWGAGRLALALGARRIHCLIASDVPGNDPAFIASGPCVPDDSLAREVLDRAERDGLIRMLPDAMYRLLDAQARGELEETPKSGHPRFASTTSRVILDRHVAVAGVVNAAQATGVLVRVTERALTGDAAEAGGMVARRAQSVPRTSESQLLVWSGETTVRLDGRSGRGGRCQELSLAAADELRERRARDVTILAAGTDGRDGPTDAAGAVVDATTWSRIAAAGIDPVASLSRHDSFAALEAAGALVRTGPTGTNVNDLVLALID